MFVFMLSLNFVLKLNQQYARIGSDNDLAPIMWQAIIWTNDATSCIWPTCTDTYMQHYNSVFKKENY